MINFLQKTKMLSKVPLCTQCTRSLTFQNFYFWQHACVRIRAKAYLDPARERYCQ